jgi:rubrerythrin
LRELAGHFAETLPSTAALFDDLCREETTHCERLRALIARADPQALD